MNLAKTVKALHERAKSGGPTQAWPEHVTATSVPVFLDVATRTQPGKVGKATVNGMAVYFVYVKKESYLHIAANAAGVLPEFMIKVAKGLKLTPAMVSFFMFTEI